MTYLMMWSEVLSWSLISHCATVLTGWLVIIIWSKLLTSRRFPNMVLRPSSFRLWSCLLMSYSSRVLPLELVVGSCHDADLALLSIAKRSPAPFACFSTSSVLNKSTSIIRPLPNYILANISFIPSTVISATTASPSVCCFNSEASICILVTTMDALLLFPGIA